MKSFNAEKLRILDATIDNRFSAAMESADTSSAFFDRTVLTVNSTKRIDSFAWMLAMVNMRKWTGERQIQERMLMDDYTIANDRYEATLAVLVEDIEDGVYAEKARLEAAELATAYTRRRNDLILDLFVSGFGQATNITRPESEWFQVGTDVLGADGVPLFSAAHPLGHTERVTNNGEEPYRFIQDSSWSNVTNLPFNAANLKLTRTAMRKQKDHYGRPARMVPNLLVVGPDNEDAAIDAVSPAVVVRHETNGNITTEQRVTNTLANAFEVFVLNELGDSPAWALFGTNGSKRPFIFVNRKGPHPQRTAQLTEGVAEGVVSESIFNDDAIKYGIRARMGAGFGHPSAAYGSTGDG